GRGKRAVEARASACVRRRGHAPGDAAGRACRTGYRFDIRTESPRLRRLGWAAKTATVRRTSVADPSQVRAIIADAEFIQAGAGGAIRP
ncbi:hypothetical protein, partial [Burkholderia sp. Cy-637]|uniref:hypothetical protein n=1 Tax=Burkholderia sp. Cy-637 TaxID=2608327 RepID=UPI0019626D85